MMPTDVHQDFRVGLVDLTVLKSLFLFWITLTQITQENLLNCFNKNQDKSTTLEAHLLSFDMINILINVLTNMVNLLNYTISPFKSTYSTLTNGNNFPKFHHKELMHTSKICFSQSIIHSNLSRSELCKTWKYWTIFIWR